MPKKQPAPQDNPNFATHVQNVVNSVKSATPAETEAGLKWYPEAHAQTLDVAKRNPGPIEDYESAGTMDKHGVGGNNVGSVHPAMARAAGEVAALSPARPAGMRWEHNVPAAAQLKDVTPEQRGSINDARSMAKRQSQAMGALKSAKNRGAGVDEAQGNLDRASEAFKVRSAQARAPFKDTPLGHAGVHAIGKALDIQAGDVHPYEALGTVKERHFAHDLSRPHDAEKVFHGASGTIDEHMKNVMEGPEVSHGWKESAAALSVPRTAPDPGTQGGYVYGRSVLHEAARQLRMRPNAAQPVSWVHEKATKPRTGNRGTK